MAASKTAKPPVGLVLDATMPAVAQAVSLALTLLRVSKMSSWSALAEALEQRDETVLKSLSTIRITAEQASLIGEYEPILAHIRPAVAATRFKPGKPAVAATARRPAVAATPDQPATVGQKAITLVVCPTCQRFMFTTSSTPTKCSMRLGCTGKPVKASAAPYETGDEAGDT